MSNIIGEAFVRVRPDTKGFATETKRGVTSGLRSAAGIAGVSLGVAGVVREIKAATAAARESQTVQLQAAAALKANGDAWEVYGSQVEAAANKQAELQAFDDEDVVQGFTRIYRNVRDVGKALELTALAGDLATARMTNGQRDLAGAALIVSKVAGGNVGILKRYGIEIQKGATATQALAALQERVAGSAEAFASGSEGSAARLAKTWGDTQEIIGGALLPALDNLNNRVGAYLKHANETGETQRRVNEIMDATGDAVRGVAEGIDLIRTVAGPAIEALGGIERVAKLVVIAFAVSKVAKFVTAVRGAAASFGFLAASSRAATIKVEADAAAASRALDAAYRPRNVVVTTTYAPGTPVPGKTAPVPVPNRSTRVPGTTGTRGTGLVGLAGIVLAGVGLSALTEKPSLAQQQLAVAELAAVDRQAALNMAQRMANENGTPLAQLTTSRNPAFKRRGVQPLTGTAVKVASSVPVLRPEEGTRGPGTTTAPPPPRRTPRLTFKQVQARIGTLEELQQDARLASDSNSERRALNAEKAFLNAQIADKKRSTEQRRELKSKLESVENDLARLDSNAESAADQARSARVARAQAADDARTKRLQDRIDDFQAARRRAALRSEAAERKALREEETWLRRAITQTKAGSARRKLLRDELLSVQEDLAPDKASRDKTSSAAADKGVAGRLHEFDQARREAALRDDQAGEKRILEQREAFVRAQIRLAKRGSQALEDLQDELLTVREELKSLGGSKTSVFFDFDKVQEQYLRAQIAAAEEGSTRRRQLEKQLTDLLEGKVESAESLAARIAAIAKELAGAGVSTASHISTIIRSRTTTSGSVYRPPSGVRYFANGGPVAGTDTVPAMLTPGEIVFNGRHQTRLASMLGVPDDPHTIFKTVAQGYAEGGTVRERDWPGDTREPDLDKQGQLYAPEPFHPIRRARRLAHSFNQEVLEKRIGYPVDRAVRWLGKHFADGGVVPGRSPLGGIYRDQGVWKLRVGSGFGDRKLPLRRNISAFLDQWEGRGLSPAKRIDAERWWGEHSGRIIARSRAHPYTPPGGVRRFASGGVVTASTATASRGRSTTASSASGDDVLRAIAAAQAERDNRRLAAAQETNRLLRTLLGTTLTPGQARTLRQGSLAGAAAAAEDGTGTRGLP